jgi:hypothetical protein
LLDELGEENLRGTVDEALAEARGHLGIVPFDGIAEVPAESK